MSTYVLARVGLNKLLVDMSNGDKVWFDQNRKAVNVDYPNPRGIVEVEVISLSVIGNVGLLYSGGVSRTVKSWQEAMKVLMSNPNKIDFPLELRGRLTVDGSQYLQYLFLYPKGTNTMEVVNAIS